MTAEHISPDLLRKMLRYEPDTGKLYWQTRTPDMFKPKKESAERLCRRFNATFAGKEAFTASADGYLVSNVLGKMMKAHRAAWCLSHGVWPTGHLDHINRDRSDNRIANLREVSRSENNRNVSAARGGTSRYLGVHFDERGKWVANIKLDRKSRFLGRYATEAEAAAAYDAAAKAAYGDFAALNFHG